MILKRRRILMSMASLVLAAVMLLSGGLVGRTV